jgi:hypothetical protein
MFGPAEVSEIYQKKLEAGYITGRACTEAANGVPAISQIKHSYNYLRRIGY